MRWFGEPWPSPELRAPVCQDDNDRIDVPDAVCFDCEAEFEPDDRGVEMPYIYKDDEGASHYAAVHYHLRCFFKQIMTPEQIEDLWWLKD